MDLAGPMNAIDITRVEVESEAEAETETEARTSIGVEFQDEVE